jgi:hypothetical protein
MMRLSDAEEPLELRVTGHPLAITMRTLLAGSLRVSSSERG